MAADFLYGRYFQKLCGCAVRKVAVDLAQDVVNEAMWELLKHPPLASEDEFRRLAYRITLNRAIDAWRRKQRRREQQPGSRLPESCEVTDLSGEPSHDPDPEAAAASAEFWAAFHACQDGLTEVHREVFRQWFYGAQSGEVGAALGRTAADVRVNLGRAREKLRHCLESKGYETERKEGRRA